MLRGAAPGTPWALLAAQAVCTRLGPQATQGELQRALQLVQRSMQASTGRTYTSCLIGYLDFCEREGLAPMPAPAATVYRYALHVSERLTADTLARHLTAINGLHSDLGYAVPVPPGDQFMARLRRGLVAVRGEERRDIGPALPAEAAWAILEDLMERGAAVDLDLLRAGVAVLVTYRSLARSNTSINTLVRDVWEMLKGGLNEALMGLGTLVTS